MTTTPIQYIDPKDIIVDFLRHRVEDPRKRAEKEYTQYITGDGSTKEFTITPPTGEVSCLTDVEFGGASLTKWGDYYFYYRDNTLVFLDTYGAPNGEVKASFKYGDSSWVFGDKPRDDLGVNKFPRLSVQLISGPGNRLGNYQAPINYTLRFQVDVWVKPNSPMKVVLGWNDTTARTRSMANQELASYIGLKVLKAFEDHEDDLFPLMHNYVPLTIPKDMLYDAELNCFHSMVEFNVQTEFLSSINE